MIKRVLPFLLSFVFLAAAVVYVGKPKLKTEIREESASESVSVKPAEELRGVWVTYMTLDVSQETDKESAFKQRIDAILSDMQTANLNTMIVQVRPFCDALYPSRVFPWSHILTGTQGEDPGYDPLAYIVEKSHECGIAVHAWLNPYRIRTQNTPSALSGDHPYSRDSSIGAEVNGSLYLDPASEKAKELIVCGAAEIAENYDIDGIQFDDYFYPPDCGDFDRESYEAYCAETDEPLPLDGFRKENVSSLLEQIYRELHRIKQDIRFGVSPQGNLKNNDGIYADVVKWCTEKGYIDYICPQIYFSLDNPALTFEDGLKEWLALDLHDGLSLYVGIPAYKAGTNADSGTWLDNNDILKTELEIVREKCDGFMLYSYDSFHNEENAEEVQNVIRYLTSE